jgi:hypothetical protein
LSVERVIVNVKVTICLHRKMVYSSVLGFRDCGNFSGLVVNGEQSR